MKSSTLTALLASGALVFAGAMAPALAASPMSEAFVANVRPNVDFLDSSSRLALQKSPSSAIRAFAHDEAGEQTIAGNSLVAWDETNTRPGEALALGIGPVDGNQFGPVGGLAALPLNVAGNVTAGFTNGIGGVLTGRSVATGRQQPGLVGNALLPSEQRDMQRLRSLNGREFNTFYRSTQRDSLLQLATVYRDYVANGDDPALLAIARRELPRIERRLAELRRL